jgi:hypothetical protein
VELWHTTNMVGSLESKDKGNELSGIPTHTRTVPYADEASQFRETPFEGKRQAKETKEESFGQKSAEFLTFALNDIVVTVASVVMTHWTKHGNKQQGLFAGFANGCYERGMNTRGFFQKFPGVDASLAGDLTGIAWSIFDGTLILPVVKGLDDNSTAIARTIDRLAGTTPADPDAYTEKPKRSWGNIGTGRMLAAATVLPVCIALNKFGVTNDGQWGLKPGGDGGFTSINGMLFDKLGGTIGNISKKIPIVRDVTQNIDVSAWASTILFETVYTVICGEVMREHSLMAAKYDQEKNKHTIPDAVSMVDLDRLYKDAPRESFLPEYSKDKNTPTARISSASGSDRVIAEAQKVAALV